MGLLVNTMRTEEKMNKTQIRQQIEGLRHMTVGQLKDKYREAFGEESRSSHKQFLFRRIAWRLQANAWGGLSERARRRAMEIANDADLRIRAPKNFLKGELDPRRTGERASNPTRVLRLRLPATTRAGLTPTKSYTAASRRSASTMTARRNPRPL